MSKLFENDSESDTELRTNNDYAKNYNLWRKKEELNKLKTKYGEDFNDEYSSSSSDDDEDVELSENFEKQFFKTLSCLKNKDPSIYNENVTFFEKNQMDLKKLKPKVKDEQPMYLKDYERKLLLEKGGQLSDSDEEEQPPRSPTYVEEQRRLKENLKDVLQNIKEEEDEEAEWGGMFKVRNKTHEEKLKEEEDYKQWLSGHVTKLEDKETETELKPLKEYWTNPQLDEGEKFLRDYILKRKFLENEDVDHIPSYDEIVHDSDEGLSEDEEAIAKQEEFEHKYNYRFEEPDPDFIKRYPRTVENSLRKTDDKRKLKRTEVKERKEKEKQQKKEELKKLQELKRKEIEEKLEKLKEIAGNEELQFQEEDLEGDFDPEAYDKRMKSLFSEEFYEGPEENQKPRFPELDEELEIENYDNWENEEENKQTKGPHCEDEDFNMDCDYNPTASVQQELIENSRRKKKRRRKSKFAKLLAEPKPIFDPNDKTFEEYLEEYYKLDCEDIIGDIPCRFKYRKVAPNSFGLSVAEILAAKDRELNRWCSLKKAVQIRPDEVEKYDQTVYERKGQNEQLKRKILPSLFSTEADEVPPNENGESASSTASNEKKQSKKCIKVTVTVNVADNQQPSDAPLEKDKFSVEETSEVKVKLEKVTKSETKSKAKKRKAQKVQDGYKNKKFKGGKKKFGRQQSKSETNVEKITDSRLSAYGINAKKFKNKLKYANKK